MTWAAQTKLLGAFLCLVLLCTGLEASEYRVADLVGEVAAEYVVVAADAFAESCDDILKHRAAGGYSVALVTLSDITAAFPQGTPVPTTVARFLSHAYQNWGTRYVLLVGDAAGEQDRVIPMSDEPAAYYSTQFLSERRLGTDFLYSALGGQTPLLHVGRFPADNADELARMIGKTIAYETTLRPGPWQKRISFVAGTSGFDPAIDAIIQSQFTQVVTGDIPPEYDIEVAHGRPGSAFCPFPPEFSRTAVKLLNEGSLMYVYVGHGVRKGFDDVKWCGKDYPIFDARSLPLVSVREGLPIMAVVACHTAFADSKDGDSIGEELMALPAGPVAYIGSTRVCQPYGNALFGRQFVLSGFRGDAQTIGEILDVTRAGILAPDSSPFRLQADTFAAMVQGAESLPGIRSDTVRHYILLGDPALRVRRPATGVVLDARAGAESTISVSGKTPFSDGQATVSFETRRDAYTRELPELPPEDSEEYAAAANERYRLANTKAYFRRTVPVKDGAFEAELSVPADLQPGKYLIKAFAWDDSNAAAGALEWTIEAPAEP